jgi:hypothetical protein
MRTDTTEKVLEKLATSDKATIVIERQPGGKMRVTSGSWDGEKVILRDQVLEVHNVEGGCTSRESLCTTDKGNPQIEPYGPGISSLTTARDRLRRSRVARHC